MSLAGALRSGVQKPAKRTEGQRPVAAQMPRSTAIVATRNTDHPIRLKRTIARSHACCTASLPPEAVPASRRFSSRRSGLPRQPSDDSIFSRSIYSRPGPLRAGHFRYLRREVITASRRIRLLGFFSSLGSRALAACLHFHAAARPSSFGRSGNMESPLRAYARGIFVAPSAGRCGGGPTGRSALLLAVLPLALTTRTLAGSNSLAAALATGLAASPPCLDPFCALPFHRGAPSYAEAVMP